MLDIDIVTVVVGRGIVSAEMVAVILLVDMISWLLLRYFSCFNLGCCLVVVVFRVVQYCE